MQTTPAHMRNQRSPFPTFTLAIYEPPARLVVRSRTRRPGFGISVLGHRKFLDFYFLGCVGAGPFRPKT